MTALENAIITLNRLGSPRCGTPALLKPDGRASLAVTVIYLVAMLSLPLTAPVRILWFAVYPIVASALAGLPAGRLMLRSLYIVPLLALFAAFNPVFDREPMMLGGIVMARGWVTLAGIVLRGVLAFQALMILVETEGFAGMCDAMRRLHVPSVLTTQLLMVHRYLTVLLTEAQTMLRARRARGYSRRHLSIGEWGTFAGQLFLRTVARSERIHRAMLARGFTGYMPRFHTGGSGRWSGCDTLWLAGWGAVIAALRFIDFPSLIRFIMP